jgi:hypothetical protein
LLEADSNISLLKEVLLKWNKLKDLNRYQNTEQLLNMITLKQPNTFLMKRNSLTIKQLNTSLNKFPTPTKNHILITFHRKKLLTELDSINLKELLLTQLLLDLKLKLFTQLLMPYRALHQLLDKYQLKFLLLNKLPILLSSDHH